jgi:hypothetical protein
MTKEDKMCVIDCPSGHDVEAAGASEARTV